MSDALQSQWAKLAGFIVGYQATWITDIGLKTGLFQAIADAGDGTSDTDVAARLDLDLRYVQLWCRSAHAFELLEWDHAAGYRLTPEMQTLLCEVRDDHIAELTVYCSGDWDAELRGRHAAEAPLIRP